MLRSLLTGVGLLLVATSSYAQNAKSAQLPVNEPTSKSPAAAASTPAIAAPVMDHANRFWFGAEALGWWTRGQSIPALVTTSPLGTPLANAGVLGAPGTAVLAGNNRVNDDIRFGGRFSGGMWLDDCQHCGIGAEFLTLSQSGDTQSFSSTGTPILARPFSVFPMGTPSSQIVAFPSLATGSVRTDASSNLLGAGIFGLKELCCGCNYRVYALAGYRFLWLDDEVGIAENLTSTGRVAGSAPVGTSFFVSDSYRTTNQFHGADLGLVGRVTHGCLFLDLGARLGIGATIRRLDADGSTVLRVPGQSAVTLPGGLLVPGAGRHVSDCDFSLVPDLRVNLGYQLSRNLEVFVGYNIMWWTNVVRAGEQIDTRVNPGLLPPPIATGPVPTLPLSSSTFWAQGISLGLNLRY